MATLKEMINGDAPADENPFQGIKKSGDLTYSNGNMTVKLIDRDGAFYQSSIQDDSGALKLEVKPNWSVRLKVESANAGFFNGNMFQSNFWERHERIYRASGGDDFEVDLQPFETIEFDVDRKSGNGIADFHLAFTDKTFSHEGAFAPNDPFWITLVSSTYDDPNPDIDPVEIKYGLEAIYEATPSSGSPFSVFTIVGDHTWKDRGTTLRLKDYDRPTFNATSGAVLMEVEEGHYVKLNIMNEDNNVFEQLEASLSLNPRLNSEDFGGGDSDFTITLYGGSILYADADGTATDLQGAFGAAFYLSDGVNSYSIGDPINDEYEIKLISWGRGDDPYLELPFGTCEEGFTFDPVLQECVPNEVDPNPDKTCPEGYVFDEESQTCVLIPPTPPTIDPTTDPFDLVDEMPSPFDEDDELVDRLVKSFTFGVNGAFRAIESVIEGMLIALPAVIVIGSAVVLSRVMMKATEAGAAKVAQQAKSAKDFLTSGNGIKVEGVGLE